VVTVGLLAGYLVFALLLGETVLGVEIRLRHAWTGALALLALSVALGRAVAPRRRRRLSVPGALAGIVLLALVVADTVVAGREIRDERAALAEGRRDPTVSRDDLDAPRFFPTDAAFTLYKPGFRGAWESYGDLYTSRLRRSPTLARNVLERRRVTVSIDAHGFRTTAPVAAARVFALGDSYTHGPTIAQEARWTELLAERLGEPVYNLGVDGAAPDEESRTLAHVLRVMPVDVRHLLWTIFEGNDLEELNRGAGGSPGGALERTLVGFLSMELPGLIREQSVLGRLRPAARATAGGATWRVDGVELAAPLYRSARLGDFLVDPVHLERARQPASYVAGHPNLPRLEATFADVRALASAHGFEVTVVIAPSAPRLHASELGGAGISGAPHLIDAVAALAARAGFRTVNLYEALRPAAAGELLYFRDDTHWNARGNRLVAETLARRVFGR
jgi:lysophospholipase L1-like esterase